MESEHEVDEALHSRWRFGARVCLPVRGGRPAFPLDCARRDVQIVTLLEEHGEAQDIPGDILFEAFWTMKLARDFCYAGEVPEGLALYDSIFVTTTLAARTQLR
jgi:hypothetical protein